MILVQPQYLPALAQSWLLRVQFGTDRKRGVGPSPTPPSVLQRPRNMKA